MYHNLVSPEGETCYTKIESPSLDLLITATLLHRSLHGPHLLLTLPLLLLLPPSPILRHPRQPIQPHRRDRINSNIHPNDAEIPPASTITTADRAEERIRALNGTEIACVCCVWVEDVAAGFGDPCLLYTSPSPRD